MSEEINKIIEEMGVERDSKLKEIYTKQLALIDREIELRKKFGMVKTEPDFEFEKEKEYQEFLFEAYKLQAESEKVTIQSELDKIYQFELQRAELKNKEASKNE